MGQRPRLGKNSRWVDEAVARFQAELSTVVAAYRDQGKDPRTVLGEPREFAVRALRAVTRASPTTRGGE